MVSVITLGCLFGMLIGVCQIVDNRAKRVKVSAQRKVAASSSVANTHEAI